MPKLLLKNNKLVERNGNLVTVEEGGAAECECCGPVGPVFTQGCSACVGSQSILSIALTVTGYAGAPASCATYNTTFLFEQLMPDGSVDTTPNPTQCWFRRLRQLSPGSPAFNSFDHLILSSSVVGKAAYAWSTDGSYSSISANGPNAATPQVNLPCENLIGMEFNGSPGFSSCFTGNPKVKITAINYFFP